MAAMAQKETQVDKNFEAFTELLPKLLLTHAGKFAVMHDGAVAEFFDSLADAVRFGAKVFGEGKFSVQEVTSKNVNLGFYSYNQESPEMQEELLTAIYKSLRAVKVAQARYEAHLQARIEYQKEVDRSYGALGDAKRNLQENLDALSAIITVK